ncbi:MAG: S66 peptidase family protein [Eubacterium sp.]|nr:S66 peptidase family protein [Eubacterium sp.]
MRFPHFLPQNGMLGFIAPSFGAAMEPYRSAYDNAKKKFAALGLRYKEGPNVYADQGIGISNRPKLCGEELNSMMTDPEVDAVITTGGGELMCEVIPYMDFDRIRKAEPKWYMGYSDNTNYTFLSATLADTAAVYGPCAPAFGMKPWHPAIQDALDLLMGKTDFSHSYRKWESESLKTPEKPLEPYHVTEENHFRYFLPEAEKFSRQSVERKDSHGASENSLRQEKADFSGRLLGGCVDSLVTILGTRFDKVQEFNEKYGQEGIIWFLECCDLNVLGMRRAFWQMKEAGWFQCASGFLIGRPYHMNEPIMGLDQYDAVTKVLEDLKVPVIMDLDIGHRPPMMPLITGAKASVKAEKNDVRVNYIFE